MRFLLIIALVVLCMASTIRVDGVWPPASINQQVAQTVRQIVEPARLAGALLDELLNSGSGDQRPPRIPEPASMIRAVADGHPRLDSSRPECG